MRVNGHQSMLSEPEPTCELTASGVVGHSDLGEHLYLDSLTLKVNLC